MRSRVCETVDRPSVCPVDGQQQQRRAATLPLSALQTGYIDRQRRAAGAVAQQQGAAAGVGAQHQMRAVSR